VEDVGGTVELEVAPAQVLCGEVFLRQILWNLVDNGLKFRRPDVAAVLAVRGRVAEARYELSVSDNGLGMTPDETSHVFEPFYRAPRTSNTAGTGLGLAIVNRIVEACEGSIAVDSTLGVGTTFRLALPVVAKSGIG
jgi:two-component system OmpR family sensor kinase